MKRHPTKFHKPTPTIFPTAVLYIQAPLPGFFNTLPKLLTIKGQGRGLAGSAPLAPPEEPAHE